jgi:hypothetical protein
MSIMFRALINLDRSPTVKRIEETKRISNNRGNSSIGDGVRFLNAMYN